MIPEGGRTSYAGDVLGHRRGRDPPAGAGRGAAGRGGLRRPAPDHRPRRGARRPRARGVGHRLQHPLGVGVPPGRRRGGAGRQRPRRARGLPARSASSTPSWSRRPPWPSPTPRRGHACTSTPAGRACGTTATRSPSVLGVDPGADHRRAGVQRRGLRRQGGHGQPGARPRWPPGCSSGRSSACCPGRRASSLHPKRHPIEMEYRVGCDAEGRLTAVHARMLGDSGAYASVGMKVLERAAGHASGPYHVPAIDVRSVAARTNNPICGAFRGFGANQAQFAMEGCLDRLAEQVGHLRLGDPQAQRHPPRAGVGAGPGHGRRLRWAPSAASTRSAPTTTAPWPPAGPSGSASGSRTAGSATASRSTSAPSCTSPRTAPSRSATAGRRWARASTPSPSRWR